ncbi:hypothetical protein, partial [Arthrobacter sp. Cr_A7]|uniref:hypothetical protein n=1 Tax=Arthrobacter sp. Cr_A7 TaxID=3031017 RepID=UPI0023DB9C26
METSAITPALILPPEPKEAAGRAGAGATVSDQARLPKECADWLGIVSVVSTFLARHEDNIV